MNKINPTGLKGYEITDRIKELMGTRPMAENTKPSSVELTKLGPDDKVYAIVRENHEYYIKVADKKTDLVVDDFKYIGGLKNKKDWAYHSYEKATKHLNLKFISLQEAYDVKGPIDILKDEKLIKEEGGDAFMINPPKLTMFQENSMSECCGAPMKEGKCSQCGGTLAEAKSKNNPWAICTASVGREDKAKYERCVMDIKKEKGIKENLNEEEYMAEVEDNDGKAIPTNGTGVGITEEELDEVQQAVEDMTESKRPAKTLLPKKKLSIATSLTEMDNIIDSMGSKKKVQPKK